MSAAAWFVAGWISAGIFIFLGVFVQDWWERRREAARPYPPVYSPADLERAVQRRQGLR